MVNYHLVVLVHGLWGNPSHMSYIETQLENHIALITQNAPLDEEIVIYKTGSHSGFLTYDGIDVNGKRVSDEILMQNARLSQPSPDSPDFDSTSKDRVTKLSIIGYSLGGLIARYALGVLYSLNFFDSVEPINFITFCSPHVGVLAPGSNLSVKLFNHVTPYFLAYSGKQLFLQDHCRAHPPTSSHFLPNTSPGNLPLLVWMAEPKSVFYQALSRFKYRSLYANIINDKRTCWFTSAIDNCDPFHSMVNEDHSAYQLDYVPGFSPTVIDYSKKITFQKIDNHNPSHSTSVDTSSADLWFNQRSRLTNFITRKLNWFKVLGNILLVTPLWCACFIGSSMFQRVKLNRRVNAFFKDSSNSLVYLYDLIHEDSQALANDDIRLPATGSTFDGYDVSSISSSSTHPDNWNSPAKKNDHDVIDDNLSCFETWGINDKFRGQTDTLMESVFDAINSEDYTEYHYNITNKEDMVKPQIESIDQHKDIDTPQMTPLPSDENDLLPISGNVSDEFRLDLSPHQQFIVDKLNQLSWEKFPILIRNTKATHAAAIVRHRDVDFDEGKAVISHFVRQTFKFE